VLSQHGSALVPVRDEEAAGFKSCRPRPFLLVADLRDRTPSVVLRGHEPIFDEPDVALGWEGHEQASSQRVPIPT